MKTTPEQEQEIAFLIEKSKTEPALRTILLSAGLTEKQKLELERAEALIKKLESKSTDGGL